MEKPVKAPDQKLFLMEQPHDLPDPLPVIEPGGMIQDKSSFQLSLNEAPWILTALGFNDNTSAFETTNMLSA